MNIPLHFHNTSWMEMQDGQKNTLWKSIQHPAGGTTKPPTESFSPRRTIKERHWLIQDEGGSRTSLLMIIYLTLTCLWREASLVALLTLANLASLPTVNWEARGLKGLIPCSALLTAFPAPSVRPSCTMQAGTRLCFGATVCRRATTAELSFSKRELTQKRPPEIVLT